MPQLRAVGATKGPHAITKIEDPASHNHDPTRSNIYITFKVQWVMLHNYDYTKHH